MRLLFLISCSVFFTKLYFVKASTINQTITFSPIGSKTCTDTSFILNATASSGLVVTFQVVSGLASIKNGNRLVLNQMYFLDSTHVEEIRVRARQEGNNTYNAAQDVFQTFTVKTTFFKNVIDNRILESRPKFCIGENVSLSIPASNFIQSVFNYDIGSFKQGSLLRQNFIFIPNIDSSDVFRLDILTKEGPCIVIDKQILIEAKPRYDTSKISILIPENILTDRLPIQLSATPTGGNFYVNNSLSGNNFDYRQQGNYVITYKITDTAYCNTGTKSKILTVQDINAPNENTVPGIPPISEPSDTISSINNIIIAYNVVTPNNDNKNDYLYFENLEVYPQNKLTLYDKKGDIIKIITNYTNDWSPDVPIGNYYYKLEYGDKNKVGNLLILR